VTGDALLTQRKFARHLVKDRKAHYHFTAKGNQKGLLEDIAAGFENWGNPDFAEPVSIAHGRIESRSIRTTTELNDYLNFPYVGQTFVIERHVIHKKNGQGNDRTGFWPYQPNTGTSLSCASPGDQSKTLGDRK